MTFATRGDLLRPAPRRFDEMTLPVSGLRVRFRSLSESEYAAYQLAGRGDDENPDSEREGLRTTRTRLIASCLCDESGSRILTDADADALAELDAGDSAALFDRLTEHCGLARGRKAIDDAKKNSNAPPASASSTASPSPAGGSAIPSSSATS